jgi:hypothetical protein
MHEQVMTPGRLAGCWARCTPMYRLSDGARPITVVEIASSPWSSQ